jgi:NAD(P)-dependent dehydrogenase (short-subunit alcohol dehydrogenase family)
MENLEGKVAFITGGASGIGLGIAKACVNAGMKVVISDIRQDHLDEAVELFQQVGRQKSVHAIRLDVTDRDALAQAANETERVFGNIHLLVNNAGVGILGPVKQAKFGDWDWGLGVLLGGVVNGIQIFLPRLLKHGEGGHIVNTSSMAGVLPLPGSSIYCTAKGAVVALSEALRGELAADNIGVSAFCPGPVSTNIREAGRTRPEKYRKDSGYAQLEKQLQQRPNSPNWMSIEECGERVLRGIRNNDLYIFTHREFKEGVAERMEAMVASFPKEEINRERAKEIASLTSNPIFKQASSKSAGK